MAHYFKITVKVECGGHTTTAFHQGTYHHEEYTMNGRTETMGEACHALARRLFSGVKERVIDDDERGDE
jgi:hypothetical protein